MGVSCMTANIIGYYCCCRPEEYKGNIIFKTMKTDLVVQGGEITEEEQKALDECQQQLNNSEEERKKIADKFKIMLRDTGAGVLTKPTLERAIITYVIYFFEQVILCANQKSMEFDIDDFSLTNFITLTEESPFIAFNQQTLDNIKDKYGFDFNTVQKLKDGQRSIIDFLTTISSTKTLLNNQYDTLKSLLTHFRRHFALINVIKNSMDGILFIINYFSELTKSLIVAQGQIANPVKLELFYRIASKAAEKGIIEPGEIALFYSIGENCGNIEKWEDNCVYKKLDLLKY